MSDAQSREPEACEPPTAITGPELAEEDARCRERAEELVDWVRDLQTLILGGRDDRPDS